MGKGWISKNLGGSKADETTKAKDHTHNWSAWTPAMPEWMEESTCACGTTRTRMKR